MIDQDFQDSMDRYKSATASETAVKQLKQTAIESMLMIRNREMQEDGEGQ